VSTVKRHRWKNIADTAGYMQSLREGRVPVTESEELDDAMWRTERVALELRTRDGLDVKAVMVDQEQTARLDALGLIVQEHDRIHLTREGMALADVIAGDLLA
jgi:oxygen-independent coproporphyrinogen-3 oxidase